MWKNRTSRRIGALKIIPVVWRHGGPWERFFLLFSLANTGLAVLVGALVLWLVLKSVWPDEVGWTYALPLLSFMLLNQAIIVPLYSDCVLQEGLRRGWMADERADEEFYEELARYKEAHRKNGQLPGDMTLGFAAWILFYVKVAGAIAYAFALYKVLGSWTPFTFAAVDLPLSFAFMVVYGRRATRQLKEAETRGFPLMRLYRSRSDVVQARSTAR
jgi:hypothetical protein